MSSVNVERTGDVLSVTLARPESRNALDAATIRELTDAFADVGDVRVVLLAGEGQSFSAGADLEWMRASVELDYDDNLSDALRLAEMIERIALCPVPVMARVHGHVFGAACGLVACADIAIAHRDTVFAFSEVKLGIIPAVISPYIVDTIGPSWSRRLFTTGERFGAETACRIGLVHEIADNPDDAVDRVLRELLLAGPEAINDAKRLIVEPVGSGAEAARRIAARRVTHEAQEGLRAFLERRPPQWQKTVEVGEPPSTR